jgi:RHS repeat-associated protein
VTDSYSYDVWGNLLSMTGGTTNWLRYVGRLGYYFDADPSTHYVRARVYASQSTRWLSRDPLFLEGVRSGGQQYGYVYAQNNPPRYSDPGGLEVGANLIVVPTKRPRPLPPTGITDPFRYGYGWYCGLNRKGPPRFYFPPIPPIDPLDAACKRHDKCLGSTFWEFCSIPRHSRCDNALCNEATDAKKAGCLAAYPIFTSPFYIIKYQECIEAASAISTFFCTLGRNWNPIGRWR